MTDYTAAHAFSSRHREQLERDRLCGCFHCLAIYAPSEIKRWLKEPGGGETALCPRCGIDAVIGESAGYPITEEFLSMMHVRWFSSSAL